MMASPPPLAPGEHLKRLTIRLIDAIAFLRWRKIGLRKYELLAVKPSEITSGYGPEGAPPPFLGAVNARFWDYPRVAVAEARGGTVRICIAKVHHEDSWKQAGEKERLWQAWKTRGDSGNFEEFWKRKKLGFDSLLGDIRNDGFLKTRTAIEGSAHFRERDGIGVLIGPQGEIAVCSGHHRLGIAIAFGLEKIPVCLVGVDPQFVKSGWQSFYSQHRFGPA